MSLKQLPLFSSPDETEIASNKEEWGTFKDSLRAPIHNWFTYPAGFSYKAVLSSLKQAGLSFGNLIYDPFMGSGTTNVVAKKLGVNSYGIEAHPFVFQIARTKLNWEIDLKAVEETARQVEQQAKVHFHKLRGERTALLQSEFPELVRKCYEEQTLLALLCLRDNIRSNGISASIQQFLSLGLTSVLRQVSSAATGWPYIAPKKQKLSSANKDAFVEFRRQIEHMIRDVEVMRDEAVAAWHQSSHHIYNADARNTVREIDDTVVDHVFTSPPYLNNFDYADRTRLELYFFGEAKSWNDITKNIRTRLITSATTQITRDDPRYLLSPMIRDTCPDVFNFLVDATAQLSELRLKKGGKKSYDHLVAGYFNDMFLVISDLYRVLKPKTSAVLVLGDSAPYGVYIPTDELIGLIGLGVGFANYSLDMLRTRGEKWKDNPQRHGVSLRESIVTLRKL